MSDTKESVSAPVIDAVTATNLIMIGQAPAMAMGSLYQTLGNSMAMAAANAVYAQQQANITFQATTALCVKMLLDGK